MKTTLDRNLEAVWKRQQRLHISSGLLAFCRWSIPMFLLGMLIDWLTFMPAAGRVIILLVIASTASYRAWIAGWRHLRTFNLAHTALAVENEVGGLESLLITAVQLRSAEAKDAASNAMVQETCSQAERAGADLRPTDIVRFGGLRRSATIAASLVAVIAVFAVVNGPFLLAGIARILPPWSAMEYPTRTQIAMVNSDGIVKEGQPALIQAEIGGVIPKQAKLAIRTGTGEPRVRKLDITEGRCEYAIQAAFRSFEYRLTAGDKRTPWRKMTVIPSPRITAAALTLEFPAYTRRTAETVDGLTVTVPENTRIKWALTLDRAVSTASLQLIGSDPEPLTVSSDGRTVTMERLATESRAYAFSWTEKEHSFTFESPSHYLQVAPDLAPRVELTHPAENLYATLGRKLDLAYRARDDHGIGDAKIVYRVNKIEEAIAAIPVPAAESTGVQSVDWDYRTALPNLAIGDSVSFVIQVADRYPGSNGPHVARSQSRRISFLSREDYLAQIDKQKKRLLLQLRTIYREQRGVVTAVRDMDTSDDSFVQSCQLEAVRQDLMKERLFGLKARMDVLLKDLAANAITNPTETAAFTRLTNDLQSIADQHLTRAAEALRALAVAESDHDTASRLDHATQTIDASARELAIQILQIGYVEATEVMARELHAISETQANLRLQTMTTNGDASRPTLADSQTALATWLNRLIKALPIGKETNIEEALVAFTLTRLSKELQQNRVDANMQKAVSAIRGSASPDAVIAQAEVIRALLLAEFRLRPGAEDAALRTAHELFVALSTDHKNLQEAYQNSPQGDDAKDHIALVNTQKMLQHKRHLLLLPAIPAARARLLDDLAPTAPDVAALLHQADTAMTQSLDALGKRDRPSAMAAQLQASRRFDDLAAVVTNRMRMLNEHPRSKAMAQLASAQIAELSLFIERQLVLLEKTEDAADDDQKTSPLAEQQQILLRDVRQVTSKLQNWTEKSTSNAQFGRSLQRLLAATIGGMTKSIPALATNEADTAIEQQEVALEAMEQAVERLTQNSSVLSQHGSMLVQEKTAQRPGPLVADIESEQRDLLALSKTAKPEDLPRLAVVQKNLVHAVNAILVSLEALGANVESGTTMLFAKDDMDGAAIALEANDLVEAEDAGSFVADSLRDLRLELDAFSPQYGYLLEITESIKNQTVELVDIQVAQSQLRWQLENATEETDLKELHNAQQALHKRLKPFAAQHQQVTGSARFESATAAADNATRLLLKKTDVEAAIEEMFAIEDVLAESIPLLLLLSENLAATLQPLDEEVRAIPEELKLLLKALPLISQQKVLYRQTQTSKPSEHTELITRHQDLSKELDSVAKLAASLPATAAEPEEETTLYEAAANSRKNLAIAKTHLDKATMNLQKSDVSAAIAEQRLAVNTLRHFVVDHVIAFVEPLVPSPSEAPDVSDAQDVEGDDDGKLYMPGNLTGTKPKGGRLEWQVLGSRDRAALNENFARELPLEYRAILKTYYERLAQ